jgi:gluconokinase
VTHFVVMGVSGSGKTAVGRRVAARLGYDFADADDFHSAASIEKMARAEPLDDADRASWLQRLAKWLAEQHAAGRSTVLACSALKRAYRDVLRGAAPAVRFVHLAVPRDVLLARMRGRTHFMPPELLDSQLQTLEPLRADEPGFTIDATGALEDVVASVAERMHARSVRR